MKLQTKQIDGFIKSPDKGVRAILVYGPDSGLVKERSKILCQGQVADINDPFNAAHLTGDIIENDPARLSDEANAGSLMGGKRLLRITDAGNEVTAPLKLWLKNNPSPDTLVILEAGDLKPKDSLRKLCEAESNAAALPCYVEDERALGVLIKDALRETGLTISSDAVTYLASAVKGDRARARMEIEKLSLYMGAEKNVSLHDVQQSCGDIGLYSLDDFAFAFTGGNRELAMKSVRTLMDEGSEPIVILRTLQNHIQRFHLAKSLMEIHGQSADEAMKSLQPPLFFKSADMFRAQLGRWPAKKSRNLLVKLADVEARTKQTGTPVDTLLNQLILSAAG
ncbi:MAG: DNA polymerase III subunit delta [Micavibrio aeruginosavorus]|uniref:DNA-directed DNA polymerase n=1 Tax=Micavibrio aeruginosavorus TaxID=349221 RepID=A0A2W5FRI5_9BACT|nr:MAG: DNA polymerase III subunit delta [Micavibrio aeruginosavorus]